MKESLFEEFLKENYPEENSFLQNSEIREKFNGMNSQIIANEIPVDILFIGDSITERWQTDLYFSKYGNAVNRGIGGETLCGLKSRLKEDVLALKPRLCVCTEGVNNINPVFVNAGQGKDVTEDVKVLLGTMKEDYRYILGFLNENGVETWLGSVLPLGTSDFRNDLILSINAVIREVCAEFGATYIDYHSAVVREDGKRMKNFTFGDDLHPHVKGYNAMADVLYPLLDKKFAHCRTGR